MIDRERKRERRERKAQGEVRNKGKRSGRHGADRLREIL